MARPSQPQSLMSASRLWALGSLLALAGLMACVWPGVASAQDQTPSAETLVGVLVSTSGSGAAVGEDVLRGIRLAQEQYAARGSNLPLTLAVRDTRGDEASTVKVVEQLIADGAVALLGPDFSYLAVALRNVLNASGMICLPPGATSTEVNIGRTTFRTLFSTADQGAILARYAAGVMKLKSALVIGTDDVYGRTLIEGFESVALAHSLQTSVLVVDPTQDPMRQVLPRLTADFDSVVIMTLGDLAAEIVSAIRQKGLTVKILGPETLADPDFTSRMQALAVAQRSDAHPADGVYAVTPVLLDAMNIDTMAFDKAFRARFGGQPGWGAMVAYETAMLLFRVINHLSTTPEWQSADLPARRRLITDTVARGRYPDRIKRGLLGPMVFDESRARALPPLMGAYRDGTLVSAPIQITSLPHEPIRYQSVVYTGLYLNSISEIDIKQKRFAADFYLWMRYLPSDDMTVDPSDITFVGLLEGSFERDSPVESVTSEDGGVYKLWRVNGVFSSPFDMFLYPFDRHKLTLEFFNKNAPVERLVYVVDSLAFKQAGVSTHGDEAFASLDRWRDVTVESSRENRISRSSLGSPVRSAFEFREVSGFKTTVSIQRDVGSAIAKGLVPYFTLLALLYASLFLRRHLISERIQISIGVALAAVFVLVGLESQLGEVGTVLIDYLYLLLLFLSLVNILACIATEHAAEAHQAVTAQRVQVGLVWFYTLVSLAAIGLLMWQGFRGA